MTDLVPTERLDIVWPDGVLRHTEEASAAGLQQIMAKADELRTAGKRTWFEVRYPLPPLEEGDTRSLELQFTDREATFDAIEVFEDGRIETLPPYAVLQAGGAA